jgi:hypothetical protein
MKTFQYRWQTMTKPCLGPARHIQRASALPRFLTCLGMMLAALHESRLRCSTPFNFLWIIQSCSEVVSRNAQVSYLRLVRTGLGLHNVYRCTSLRPTWDWEDSSSKSSGDIVLAELPLSQRTRTFEHVYWRIGGQRPSNFPTRPRRQTVCHLL